MLYVQISFILNPLFSTHLKPTKIQFSHSLTNGDSDIVFLLLLLSWMKYLANFLENKCHNSVGTINMSSIVLLPLCLVLKFWEFVT